MKSPFIRRLWTTFSAYVIGFYASGLNRFHVKGVENIPASGGVLIVSNHISAYETIFLPWAVVRRFPMEMLWAPAKEELFANRVQRWLYTSWGAFPVKRGRDVRAGKLLNELLRDQRVMLYPEGTRHRDGTLWKGQPGCGEDHLRYPSIRSAYGADRSQPVEIPRIRSERSGRVCQAA